MSQSAYLVAVCEKIKSELSLNSDQCEVGFDGMPKPVSGELYIAVHPGNQSPFEPGAYDLSEGIGINVTVTKRIPYTPQDRWGREILVKTDSGLDAICRKIVATIHNNYIVMNSANLLITQGDDKFFNPLAWAGTSPPQKKGPEWFSAERDQYETGKLMNAGVAVVIFFDKAARRQYTPLQG